MRAFSIKFSYDLWVKKSVIFTLFLKNLPYLETVAHFFRTKCVYVCDFWVSHNETQFELMLKMYFFRIFEKWKDIFYLGSEELLENTSLQAFSN